MPVSKFAVLDIEQTLIADGYKISIYTDVACHLWMRWSLIYPQEHIIPRYRRGVHIYDDKRFCFVTYHDNEQEEASDTFEHTFSKTAWPICQTRYFYFHGTISGVTSKSTSCIFTKHRLAIGYTLIILEPWTLDEEPPTFGQVIFEPWT